MDDILARELAAESAGDALVAGRWLYAGSKAMKVLKKVWYHQGRSWKKLVDAKIIRHDASLSDPVVRRLVFACPDINRLARECLLSERHTRRLLEKLEEATHLTIGKPEKDRDLTLLIDEVRKQAGIGRRKRYNHVYFVHTNPETLLDQLVVEHDHRIAEQAVKQDQRREKSRKSRSRCQRAVHSDQPDLFDRSPQTADMMSAERADTAERADMMSAERADMMSAERADIMSAERASAPLENKLTNESEGKTRPPKPDECPSSQPFADDSPKAASSPIDELSPAWLARIFLHCHKGVAAPAAGKVAENFAELIRVGVPAEVIRDEIVRGARFKSEGVWEIGKRLRSSGQKKEPDPVGAAFRWAQKKEAEREGT